MSSTPTGRILPADEGRDLVLTRRFRAPAADVWASITESDRTARWFGPWEGQAGPGRTIKVQMVHEQDRPWMEMTIDACEPPHHLALSAVDEAGAWYLEAVLTETDGGTELRFTQHLRTRREIDQAPESGPGWEYYLDMLTAAHEGRPLPDFADYYPALRDHYRDQLTR
ncbi:SRPBCC family protein [Nocardia farcinica]|uniref:Activator of Hsp90 ATPase homolog 1-like protein n=1 Tax=Nocardia farcinica TaxID=37329 RepID=A0A449H0I7_NOCFR|nr:SRPBCC family protein [Nocardia farcinica]MBF6417469.1 SRPBCC family protein [Nocardia farcinica]MBF6429025.1 SRPBCC family protein [Nocardia farcinica]MBF6504597.1 SRPBCC family protein [Nocardia farcinica]VFA91528.1 Activator of Hsp90 ATPase homolog 1-like protein [Nocardia farcinica]